MGVVEEDQNVLAGSVESGWVGGHKGGQRRRERGMLRTVVLLIAAAASFVVAFAVI